ncbi:hypothetical protein PVAP13_7NG398025 [Panicum virgatum]|uniref:Uncharacterized protein n=1 Tax=Panicum virgatum TaxID=38727 RepID=A0A8T0Q887_PANVG|nr:hypothetical protein PVAP13_7NG398025 [Panicum virgatum]
MSQIVLVARGTNIYGHMAHEATPKLRRNM